MLNEVQPFLPRCVCGALAWQKGNGSYGSDLCVTEYHCEACKRPMRLFINRTGHFVIQPYEWRREFTHDEFDWMTAVEAQSAAHACAVQDAIDALGDERQLAHVHIAPRFGLDPAKSSFYDIPKEAQKEIEDARNQLCIDGQNSVPRPYLAQLPTTLCVHAKEDVRGQPAFVLIDHARSQATPMPLHPHTVADLARWDLVFARLAEQGLHVEHVHTIPNQYSGTRWVPWRSFEIQNIYFRAGARRRVVHIEAENASGRCKFLRTEALARRDEVTYYTDGTNECAYIHAWTIDHIIEYIAAMVADLNS